MTRSRLLFLAPALFLSTRATWTLTQPGLTGVNGMQMSVIDHDHVVFIDKVEANPLFTNEGKHALGAIYSFKTKTARALNGIKTNSFCAGGGYLSNGTLASIGGNPLVESDGTTSADGLQGIRLLECINPDTCDMVENPQTTSLSSQRWYPSTVRVQDGSLMIIGGSIAGDWTNNPNINNPTYEFYPPKNIHGYNGTSIPMQFLLDSMPHNLFPHTILMPSGEVLICASNMCTLLNWKKNTETRLPNLPNNQHCTYPYSGTVVLLPLKPENGYQPEVLVCGGSQTSETDPTKLSSGSQASSQCSRIVITPDGIRKGWQVESMPVPITMHSALLMPSGKVLFINGAMSGTAGYGNVQKQVGASNADNPMLQPFMYDPNAPAGKRFSSDGLPNMQIPRMYHSTAALLPDGSVVIAGSNPNLDVSTQKYPTEYRLQRLAPSIIPSMNLPMIKSFEPVLHYNRLSKMQLQLPKGLQNRGLDLASFSCFLMDISFSTHGVDMNQRKVDLVVTHNGPLRNRASLNTIPMTIMGPPNVNVYPPGLAWVGCSVGGIVTTMQKVLVGGGMQPPVDHGAIKNLLAHIKKL